MLGGKIYQLNMDDIKPKNHQILYRSPIGVKYSDNDNKPYLYFHH